MEYIDLKRLAQQRSVKTRSLINGGETISSKQRNNVFLIRFEFGSIFLNNKTLSISSIFSLFFFSVVMWSGVRILRNTQSRQPFGIEPGRRRIILFVRL